MGFGDYVRFYGIARSEGVLLRYLTDAVKALRHTVPEAARTEDLQVLLDWLDEMVKQTDSSLLEEWEDLVAGDIDELRRDMEALEPPAPPRLTDNEPVFRVMVRNAMFQRVRLFGDERDEALARLSGELSADDWADALDAYFDDHEDIDDGPAARGPELFRVAAAPDVAAPLELAGPRWWAVRQVLKDPDGDLDHGINAVVDLDASDEAGHPVIRVVSVGAPESGWGL